MRRAVVSLFLLAFLLVPAFATGHLCNDVFVQAKDNLAVKVDIRDGQLRIAKEASFRVFLLNTMDREIANINMEVVSKQFDSTVAPSENWNSFPVLKTVARGGKKEYFDVTLKRKKGVRDGTYKIDLHLFNGRNKRMSFMTADLGASADTCELPKAKNISINGRTTSSEWRKSYLITDFYSYEKKGRYYENVRSDSQPRYRLAYDDKYIYALFNVKPNKEYDEDTITMYFAKATDETPLSITVNQRTGEVKTALEKKDILCKVSSKKDKVECRIPRVLLGLDDKKIESFIANFIRTLVKDAPDRRGNMKPTPFNFYWRGNRFSYRNPIIFARFVFEKKK